MALAAVSVGATSPGEPQVIETEAQVLRHIRYQDEQINAGFAAVILNEYRKLSKEHPDEGTYTYLYARLVKDNQTRLHLLRKAVEQTPRMFYAERDLGRALYASGKFQEAIEHLTRALKKVPLSARTRYARGLAYYHRGEVKRAIADFGDVVDIDPDHASSYEDLAVALIHDGQYPRAIEVMSAALERFEDAKNRHYLYRNLGIAHARLGNPEASLSAHLQAVATEPAYYDGHVSLGRLYYRSEDLDRAAHHFQLALSLQPDNGQALLQLGIVRFELDDLDASTHLLEKATRTDSARVDAYLYLSKVYQARSDHRAAQTSLQKHHEARRLSENRAPVPPTR